jgi:hypothetical protein
MFLLLQIFVGCIRRFLPFLVGNYSNLWKVVGLRPDEVNFSIYLILQAALGPGLHSASNRNEYQKQKNNVSGE